MRASSILVRLGTLRYADSARRTGRTWLAPRLATKWRLLYPFSERARYLTALKPPSKRLREIALLREREQSLPVTFHADDCPAAFLRLVIECGRESADLAVRQTLRRAVSVLTDGIVMQHQ